MRILNDTATPPHYWLVAAWLLVTLVAASFFISKKVVEFDPNQLLEKLSHQEIVEAVLTEQNAQLDQVTPSKSVTLFQFTEEGCRCNLTSQPHMSKLSAQAETLGVNLVSLKLTDSLRAVIPSTPAVLMINQQGELAYLGPYGQGFACTQNTDVVATVLNNLQKGFNSALVINQAKGCYCPTS